MAGSARWWSALHVDVAPLRASRDFRLLVAGGAVSSLGSFVTLVAIPFQVKELTGSFVAVGVLGLVELVPIVVFGLAGGAVADTADRRRVVLLCEVAFALVSTALLVNSLLPGPQLWVLYAVAAVAASVDGMQRPSLDSLVPRIVAPGQLAAAASLTALRTQVGSLLGPGLGGLLVAYAGVPWAYGLDVATFAVSVAALAAMRASPPPERAGRPAPSHVAEAVRYAWSRKDLLGTYAADLSAMLLAFPQALFPFLADDLGAPWALGLLYTAPLAGSLLVTLTSGWTSKVHRHGRAVVLAGVLWGAGVAAAGLAPDVWLVLAALVAAGAADMVSGLFRMLMWNLSIPDGLRGRMAGVELLSYALGPQLGQVRSAWAASRVGLRASVWSGGLACMAAAGLLALALPRLWAYDDRTDPDAVAQRARREAARAPGQGA